MKRDKLNQCNGFLPELNWEWQLTFIKFSLDMLTSVSNSLEEIRVLRYVFNRKTVVNFGIL